MSQSGSATPPPPASPGAPAPDGAGANASKAEAKAAQKAADRERDMDLVRRAQGGDYAAFEQLVSTHSARTFALAQGMLRNAQDAEEVVQDTFLTVFQRLDTFRGESAFSSWLYRIAANNALMRLRKRRREPVDSIETMLPGFLENGRHVAMPGTWFRSAEKMLEDRQLATVLEEALARLPPAYRVVLLMRDVDGLTNEEIADVLGLSIPAVKSRLHRARLAVREEVDRRYRKA